MRRRSIYRKICCQSFQQEGNSDLHLRLCSHDGRADQRDFDFATKFGIDITPVELGDPSIDLNNLKEACASSGEFNGLNNRVAIDRFIDLVEKEGIEKKLQIQRLISRQRY